LALKYQDCVIVAHIEEVVSYQNVHQVLVRAFWIFSIIRIAQGIFPVSQVVVDLSSQVSEAPCMEWHMHNGVHIMRDAVADALVVLGKPLNEGWISDSRLSIGKELEIFNPALDHLSTAMHSNGSSQTVARDDELGGRVFGAF